jgi:lantibiotic modifying enzyme
MWKYVVENSLKKSILEKVDEIAAVLLTPAGDVEKIGLLDGKMGIALFLFYYAEFSGDEKYYDRAMELLLNVFDEINEGFDYDTFCMGIAGVGWAVEHLTRNDFIKADTREMLAEVDPYIHQAMMRDIQNGHYDYLHGAVGHGIYFLSRLAHRESEDYLIAFLDELEKRGIKNEDGGVKWRSMVDYDREIEGFNLSLSHGLASIIAFLGRLYEAGIRRERAGNLLTGAVRYLLQQQLDTRTSRSIFPRYVCEQEPPHDSRLAWCYGDLGIGMALWQAAQIVGNIDWQQQAVDILRHSTGRRDLAASRVKDACMCHGTAGIAHVFNRMHHYTGIEDFRESAVYWLRQTMEMARFDDGCAGFKLWHGKETGGWAAEADLLTGAAGIGLTLLSAAAEIEPRWDRCLLLS